MNIKILIADDDAVSNMFLVKFFLDMGSVTLLLMV